MNKPETCEKPKDIKDGECDCKGRRDSLWYYDRMPDSGPNPNKGDGQDRKSGGGGRRKIQNRLFDKSCKPTNCDGLGFSTLIGKSICYFKVSPLDGTILEHGYL